MVHWPCSRGNPDVGARSLVAGFRVGGDVAVVHVVPEPSVTNMMQRAAFGVDGLPAASGVSSTPVTVVNGKYVIERRLGGGGMAEVFLGRTVGAEGFSRPVAI